MSERVGMDSFPHRLPPSRLAHASALPRQVLVAKDCLPTPGPVFPDERVGASPCHGWGFDPRLSVLSDGACMAVRVGDPCHGPVALWVGDVMEADGGRAVARADKRQEVRDLLAGAFRPRQERPPATEAPALRQAA
jgi:hypothetical protein